MQLYRCTNCTVHRKKHSQETISPLDSSACQFLHPAPRHPKLQQHNKPCPSRERRILSGAKVSKNHAPFETEAHGAVVGMRTTRREQGAHSRIPCIANQQSLN
ncbi:hypothetical protein KM043_005666 [Ampulex compressa]|nr:hypothetical protein KM043_005666 [Ampulex compressa]